MILLAISFYFIISDFRAFFNERGKTVYARIGMPTYSTDAYVGKFFKSYDECMNYEPTCLDVKRVSDIFKMPKEEIDEIRYVLSNPLHREMYDKSETFVRKKTSKKAPTEGARYMSAY